jgi:hypothetical protein
MRKMIVLAVSMVAALVLAGGAALIVPDERAWAAFPGANGRVAFVSDRSGYNDDIYSVEPDGSEPTNLTRLPDSDESNPAYSPDGQKIERSGMSFIAIDLDEDRTH